MDLQEFARGRGWTVEHKPYNGSMGFLPCDSLGHKVYCVYAGDRLIGHSQLSDDKAIEHAIDRFITTHVTIDYEGTEHVVISLDKYQAQLMAQTIIAQLYHDEPHVFTFMAKIKHVDHSSESLSAEK